MSSIDEMLQSSDSELDDDDNDEDTRHRKPVTKRVKRAQQADGRKGAWLKEDEDIVDFLDPSAAKKVLGWSLLYSQSEFYFAVIRNKPSLLLLLECSLYLVFCNLGFVAYSLAYYQLIVLVDAY